MKGCSFEKCIPYTYDQLKKNFLKRYVEELKNDNRNGIATIKKLVNILPQNIYQDGRYLMSVNLQELSVSGSGWSCT